MRRCMKQWMKGVAAAVALVSMPLVAVAAPSWTGTALFSFAKGKARLDWAVYSPGAAGGMSATDFTYVYSLTASKDFFEKTKGIHAKPGEGKKGHAGVGGGHAKPGEGKKGHAGASLVTLQMGLAGASNILASSSVAGAVPLYLTPAGIQTSLTAQWNSGALKEKKTATIAWVGATVPTPAVSVSLQSPSGTAVTKDVVLAPGAPEPQTWLLMLMVVLGLLVTRAPARSAAWFPAR